MIQVSFYAVGNDDVALFTEALEHVPNVGDKVSYSFEVHDKEKWDPEAYAARATAGKLVSNWKVIEVVHLIRRLSIQGTASQVVCVMIQPVP